jgi:hypothetical protein
LPAAEQFYNYLPRVTQPVLMLNGRWDIDVPLEAQRRFYELLGTPADQKKHVLFDAGHGQLPQNQLVRATLDWYDKYLGPTKPAPRRTDAHRRICSPEGCPSRISSAGSGRLEPASAVGQYQRVAPAGHAGR